MLFTIWLINFFLGVLLEYKNLKFKHLIDGITINLSYFRNFVNMNIIRRKYNPIVDFLEFTSNKKILNGVVAKICPFLIEQLLIYNKFR